MNALNLSYINLRAPYTMWNTQPEYYYFKTDRGAVFKVGFMSDYTIWQDDAYQFIIVNENNEPSPLDMKLKETIFCVIEAFFSANPDILLYLCDTGDGKQAARNRLFLRWFREYSDKHLYFLRTAEIEEIVDEKTGKKLMNFAALIVQKSNPKLEEIVREFDDTISLLSNKPE